MPSYRVSAVLDRLEKVREVGPRRWIARCPGHDDRRPSLSIREADDGRILLHDFGGCGAIDILESVGLDWPDLFPERVEQWEGSKRHPLTRISARDALEVLDSESLVVEIIARGLVLGEPVEQHRADLQLAVSRIAKIRAGWIEAP